MIGGNIVTRRILDTFAKDLMGLETFRENRLRVYCGVPVSDLTPMEEEQPAPAQRGWLAFLVCREEDTVLMAADPGQELWDCGEGTDELPGLLTLTLPEERNLAAVEQLVKWLLAERQAPAYRFTGWPLLAKQLPKLAQARLLTRASGGRWQDEGWIPTEYGIDCGLVLGYIRQGGSTVREGIWCSQRTRMYLKDRLTQRSAGASTRQKTEIPLSQRIGRLRQGLRSDSAYSVRAVRQLADTPLERYYQDHPAELRRLRRALPVLSDDATYQDAAVALYWLLQELRDRPELLRRVCLEREELGQLMGDLLLPLTGGRED